MGFREDETTFTSLLKFFADPANGLARLRLATGYLNLQKEYVDLIRRLPEDAGVDVLTASPRANGFHKAGRFKKYIPGLYRLNAINILKRNEHLRIHEWQQGDWTYHAKGAWLYEKD